MKSIIRAVGLTVTLFLASCSQEGDYDQSGEAELATPDISPTAAPGVAFRYEYDFNLPDPHIDEVQEAHASACERLGPQRCRITGLRYSIDAHEQVSAMLQVKLEPGIARQFGNRAVEFVERNEGRLVNAAFSGEDEGARIRSATRQQAELQSQIADIERRLAGLSPGDRERTELQQQLEQLRSQQSQARQQIAGSEERLANTPMTFNYYGKGALPGFRGTNPLVEGWRTFLSSGVTMIRVLLYAIGALLPWAALLLLIVLILRSPPGRRVHQWWRSRSPGEGSAGE